MEVDCTCQYLTMWPTCTTPKEDDSSFSVVYHGAVSAFFEIAKIPAGLIRTRETKCRLCDV